MTFDEAIKSVRARAPTDDELLAGVALLQGEQYRKEELAYQLARWARKNGTDEELAGLGMKRDPRA